MDTLIIGSFNTRNNKLHMKNGENDAKKVSRIIKREALDLLGTQELTINYTKQIKEKLGSGYTFCGNYRCGNLLAHIPYNENNCIITKQNVIYNETIRLPWIPKKITELTKAIFQFSLMPRIATIVITEDEERRKICMINTHLDYNIPSVQIRQLKVLKEIVLKYNSQYPVILTGDFNMVPKNEYFKDFTAVLKRNMIQRVPINNNTFCSKDGSDKVIDHIFIPSNWDIIDANVVDTQDISDHNMIYVKTKRN